MKRLLFLAVIGLSLIIHGGCSKKEEASKKGPGNDVFTSHYPNGQKEAQGKFKDGKMDGTWTTWYENGQKQTEEVYAENLLQSRKRWHENGRIKEETYYKNGKLDGKKTIWDEQGNIVSATEYKDGVEVSKAGSEKKKES